jgi:hypothetical protein
MARTLSTGRPRPVRGQPEPQHTWRAAGALTVAFVLGMAVAFGIWAIGSRPSKAEENVAALKQADAERDIKQTAELTELARGGRDRLTPVLQAMAAIVPVGAGGPAGPPPTADVVKGWREVLSAEVARYANPPSAGTAVNVARNGLRVAVQQLAAAVDMFESNVALAGQQRTLALRAWSVAAIQLDQINIDAGYGHAHVQLPSGSDTGVIAPDSSPEGSGGRR